MDELLTDVEFAENVERNGGIIKALACGLRASHSQDKNTELYHRWIQLEQYWENILLPISIETNHILEEIDFESDTIT